MKSITQSIAASSWGRYILSLRRRLTLNLDNLDHDIQNCASRNQALVLENSGLRSNVTTLALEFTRLCEYVANGLPLEHYGENGQPPAEILSALAVRDEFRKFADHPDILRGTADLITNVLAAQFGYSWVVLYHKVGLFLERLNRELALDANGNMSIDVLREVLGTPGFSAFGTEGVIKPAPTSLETVAP